MRHEKSFKIQHKILMIALLCFTFSSFADKSVLGHVTVLDPKYGLRDVVYANENGYAIVEDDIILMKLPTTKPQIVRSKYKPPQAMILFKLGGARWTDGIIPYRFGESLPIKNRLAIREAMTMWEEVTKVRFIEISPFNQLQYPDFLLFIAVENVKKCDSAVGRQGGEQAVLLGPNCNKMKVAHELGHALGLWHEQSRNDREQYIRILWENIEEDHLYNFNQHLNDGEDFGTYDYQSIMHYSAFAFSKNGQPTIIPLQEGMIIGQRDHLSLKDIAAVNAMYP
ncbi:MAG TPA: Dot/Icm T4SS effector Zinc-dependent metalloprotease LegP [Legionellaceae bacterium]|nr:Dot/Icm T4SS effector Zinc-dependent metalloprotease LegP [Legionellaceae bacterium]